MRESVWGVALVLGLTIAGGGSTTSVPPAHAGDSGSSVDLSGTWQFDPDRSDVGGPPAAGPGMRGGGPPGGIGGRGGPGGRGGRGGMGGRDGMRRPPREPGADSLGRRPPGPPRTLRIRQRDGTLSFADSTGAVVREIVTSGEATGADPDTLRDGGAAAGVPSVRGRWRNQRLETTHRGRRGTKRTEVFRLEDEGRTLVVESTIEIEGRGSRKIKHVYRRVDG